MSKGATLMEYILINIVTEVHWQLACEAAKHAEKNTKVRLVYETPEGEVALTVQRKNTRQVVIRRQV